jgi:5-formyltetrahydrofolate cyclo-ligase
MLLEERKALLRQACRDVVRDKARLASTLLASDQAQAHFLKEYPSRPGSAVALYRALRGEVGTDRIREAYLAAGVQLYYPAVTGKGVLAFYPHRDGDAWETGPYGIPEPPRAPGREPRVDGFDLVLVPGIAFDRGGRRLGRGFGYYDRFLGGLPDGVPRVGLGFSHQLVAEVPVGAWDVPVHALVTEEGVIRFPGGNGSPKK